MSGTYVALDGNDLVDAKTLPPTVKAFADSFCSFHRPTYMTHQPCGPFFMFEDGGWDRGWGVMIGKTNLPNPTLGVPIWTKQLQPGVYLFSF